MVASLLLALHVLRLGLAMRRRRQQSERRDPALMRRHARVAKRAVVMLLVGFSAGPISAFALRDWTPLATLHGWLGLLTASLFATAGYLGLRLERGRGRPVSAHGWLGLLALLLGALTAFAGFVLLP